MSSSCLYVGNIPKDSKPATLEDELRELFDGDDREVVEVDVPVDRRSGRGRGFAFVTLESADSAHEAREELNGAELHGQELEINRAHREEKPGHEEAPPPHLRPWNLNPQVKRRRRKR